MPTATRDEAPDSTTTWDGANGTYVTVWHRCCWCRKRVRKGSRGASSGFCSPACRDADAADCAAECRSLEAAESGEGLERLRDAEYHRLYGDE